MFVPSRRSTYAAPQNAIPLSALVVFSYEGKNYLVPKPSTHEDAVLLVQKHIMNDLTQSKVCFMARVPLLDDEDVEVTSDAWAVAAPAISKFRIVIEKRRNCSVPVSPLTPNDRDMIGSFPSAAPYNGVISIFIRTLKGKTICLNLKPDCTIGDIKSAIEAREKIPAAHQILIHSGKGLENQVDLARYGLGSGETLHLSCRLLGGKPVIYLYPQASMDVRVQLSLASEWKFSAVYPTATVQDVKLLAPPLTGQAIEWNVHARPDGLLTDKRTASEVTYLFWEAETHTNTPMTPPSSPTPYRDDSPDLYQENFIPGVSQCRPQNSALLRVEDAPLYLDRALKSLGLHVEARTSFITYWLPSILKHSHIALRFLPQVSYERAASLDITPPPDVITRVFMLFQGVDVEDVFRWTEAVDRTKEGPSVWDKVVGIDKAKQYDEKLFRVLEWGGMEVI